jgi:CHAT domain-containing protein
LLDRRLAPVRGGLLAAGGVDYQRGDAAPAAPSSAVALRPPAADRGSSAFAPLPGTRPEAEAVAALFRREGVKADILTGATATKGRLAAAMTGKRFLHLATHGYFAPPEQRSALGGDPSGAGPVGGEGMGPGEASGWYPGLLSGLVWAGAARPPTDPATGNPDPGACLMTAEEVAGLDLGGCDLAVLSACETGLGRTAGGEGVFGLQRAFHQAGARTVVASLWRIDDQATLALMTRFYSNFREKKLTPLESLRQAQLSVLDDPEFGAGGDPRLWAAWTLSGDPGGLDRIAPPAGPR